MLSKVQSPGGELISRVPKNLRERGFSDIEAVILALPALWLAQRLLVHVENIERSLGSNPTAEEIDQAIDNYPDSLFMERLAVGLLNLFS